MIALGNLNIKLNNIGKIHPFIFKKIGLLKASARLSKKLVCLKTQREKRFVLAETQVNKGGR